MEQSGISRRLIKTTTVLREDESLASAVRKLRDAELRALPVEDATGRLAGLFGEREFIKALFPGYVSELSSAAFVTKELDAALEHRATESDEPIRDFVNREQCQVPPTASDMQLAETFMHHRALMLPVVEDSRIVGVIARDDFFALLVDDYLGRVGAG